VDTPAEARVFRLVAGVREAREELTKVQLELNLQIVKLRLKARSSTPPEVREQRVSAITAGLDKIDSVVQYYTNMLEESLEVFISLQEDPNIQRLETEARELQQQYDTVKGTAQAVALTQRLVRMQQAKALTEQVDAPRNNEVVLKARVQPWIGEAFTITAAIEGKLANMRGVHIQM
jgi:hypothetical protein